MDEQKTPEDILDEIMNRTPDSNPTPTSYPPKFDPPDPDDIPLPPLEVPKQKAGPDRAAKALPWLCAALGIALVLLGVCVFRLVDANNRLEELRQSVGDVEELQSAQKEQEKQETRLEEKRAELEEERAELEEWKAGLEENLTAVNQIVTQKTRLDYLWYLSQFMDCVDYRMAALIVALSAEPYWAMLDPNVPYNPIQEQQYQAYRRELIDKGYLDPHPEKSVFPSTTTTEEWDPSNNPDMTALGILWCALEAYYVSGDPNQATHYLVDYQQTPLGAAQTRYQTRIRTVGSDCAIGMYNRLIHDLTEEGYLILEDGALAYGPLMEPYTEQIFALPFPLREPEAHIGISIIPLETD